MSDISRIGGVGADGEPDESGDSIPPLAGRYKLCERLGTGAMGVVFKAFDNKGGLGEVAIKVLIPMDFKDPSIKVRFEQEVDLMRELEHPNLIRVYDFGTAQTGQQFLVMEYVDSGTLQERIYNDPEPLSFESACLILRDVAKGLGAAHAKDIVHRDLKPANIMLSSDGTAKVADFGLARYTDVGHTITKSGETVGTPYYMAPEQFQHHRVTNSADIYALGIIAYELATKKRPFSGSYEQIAIAHLREPVPSFHNKDSLFPKWYETFTLICTEKDPKNRFRSMDDLVIYLEKKLYKMGLVEKPPVKESFLARLLTKLLGED